MKRKLAVIDTETGGVQAHAHSILSIAVLIWQDGAVIDEYSTLINEGGPLVVEKEALKVNGLTVERVKKEGIGPLQTIHAIHCLLDKHDMRSDVWIAAHAADFDRAFVQRLYRLAGQDFSKRFSRRVVCTQNGALLLDAAGRITLPGGSASLDSCVALWNISLDREGGHNALNDAHACARVLNRELQLIGGHGWVSWA